MSPLRKDQILQRDQLEKMPTKRLIAYKNRLLKVVEGPIQDSYGDVRPEQRYVTKQCPEWKEAIFAIRNILSTREHVER